MASIRDQNTRHANRCRIIVNGVVLAEGLNVTANEDGGTQGVYVINDAKAQEHVHTQYRVTLTIGKLVWRRRNLRLLNIGHDLLGLGTFDVQAMDEIDREVLWVARTCTISGRNQSINANQPINSNVQIQAVEIRDGAGANSNSGGGPSNVFAQT